MSRITSRQLAAATILTACGALALSIAAEQKKSEPAPAAQPASAATPAKKDEMISVRVPVSPAKEYVIPKKGVSDAIRKAVENPLRHAEDRARDGYRRPAELMALVDLKAGQKVIEFGTFGELDKFGQYYTTMLAEVVGPKGMIYMFDSLDVDEQLGGNSRIFAAAHPNTVYKAVDYNKIDIPRNLDVAWSVLNYHEMQMRGVDMTVFFDKLFKSMKVGAYYLVVDHAGVIGADMKDTLPMHRIDPSIVRSAVGGAGFQLVLESRMLERTDDDHKWTIHTDGKADQSDQMVYLYRKPIFY